MIFGLALVRNQTQIELQRGTIGRFWDMLSFDVEKCLSFPPSVGRILQTLNFLNVCLFLFFFTILMVSATYASHPQQSLYSPWAVFLSGFTWSKPCSCYPRLSCVRPYGFVACKVLSRGEGIIEKNQDWFFTFTEITVKVVFFSQNKEIDSLYVKYVGGGTCTKKFTAKQCLF